MKFTALEILCYTVHVLPLVRAIKIQLSFFLLLYLCPFSSSLSLSSLSNLDQDLPNSMIHNVPIKSLPQDWLWCETWCSMETKSTAKTIDLVSWYDTTSTL